MPKAPSARDSGIIYFGPRPQDGPLNDTLPAIVCTITVHQGLVSRDLIAFFSKNDNVDTLDSQLTTFEIQMLKEDGSTEVDEDNGGVMSDALCEFWNTFYVQFTEGNTHKIPVVRHDMSESVDGRSSRYQDAIPTGSCFPYQTSAAIHATSYFREMDRMVNFWTPSSSSCLRWTEW